jgi:hypothetical protein
LIALRFGSLARVRDVGVASSRDHPGGLASSARLFLFAHSRPAFQEWKIFSATTAIANRTVVDANGQNGDFSRMIPLTIVD